MAIASFVFSWSSRISHHVVWNHLLIRDQQLLLCEHSILTQKYSVWHEAFSFATSTQIYLRLIGWSFLMRASPASWQSRKVRIIPSVFPGDCRFLPVWPEKRVKYGSAKVSSQKDDRDIWNETGPAHSINVWVLIPIKQLGSWQQSCFLRSNYLYLKRF